MVSPNLTHYEVLLKIKPKYRRKYILMWYYKLPQPNRNKLNQIYSGDVRKIICKEVENYVLFNIFRLIYNTLKNEPTK